MTVNSGYIETSVDDGNFRIRVYYDQNSTPVGASQPLVDGPLGYCLEVINRTGYKTKVTLTRPNGNTRVFNVPTGDPANNGLVVSRCLTALQLALLGFDTRGEAATISFSPDE